jgi:hypothetical protein
MPTSTRRSRRSGATDRRGSRAPRSHRFRLDLREVSTVGLDDERKHLIIDVWNPGAGVRTMKRA